MPELPEVETIRRQLAETVVGAEIVGVEVRRESCYEGSREIAGEVIRGIERVGKYLYIIFESGRGLIVHLKMTGRLVIDVARYASLPHTRVVINLTDNRHLYYWDSRTFGYVKYVLEIESEIARQRARLGPEPWDMTVEQFYAMCHKYGRPIKNLILDQLLLAGVGNIYANDALWEARIDPRRMSRSLSKKEASELLYKIRFVMERGLATGGASDNSYVDGLGNKGSYQNEFRVYRRINQPCLRCGTLLKRVVIGGRGSWMCQQCQV